MAPLDPQRSAPTLQLICQALVGLEAVDPAAQPRARAARAVLERAIAAGEADLRARASMEQAVALATHALIGGRRGGDSPRVAAAIDEIVWSLSALRPPITLADVRAELASTREMAPPPGRRSAPAVGRFRPTSPQENAPMSQHLEESTRIAKRPERAPDAAPASGELRIERCPDTRLVGRVFPLRGPSVHVGRDAANLIPLNDPDVSRTHAMIVFGAGGHRLIDLQSTNGTVVNGERVQKERVLRTGDVILMGATSLTFKAY